MYDREVDVPRLLHTYGVGEPLPHPALARARGALSAHYRPELGEPFVTAGCCYYRDGRDSVAWHGDTIGRGKTQDTMVAIVSLGDPRRLRLRPRLGGALDLGRDGPRRPARDGRLLPAHLGARRTQGRPRRPADLGAVPPAQRLLRRSSDRSSGYRAAMSTVTTEPEDMDFGRLRIAFDDRVLRPRPWTAAQSEWAAEILADRARRPRARAVLRRRADRAAGRRRHRPRAGLRRPGPGGVRLRPPQRRGRRAGRARRGPRGGDRRDGARQRAVRRGASPTRRGYGAPRPAATPRTRCWRSTAARTVWTSPGAASTPRGCTCRRRVACCSSSAPSSRRRRPRRLRGDELGVTEVRWHERGVLVRIDPALGRPQLRRQHLVGAVAPRHRPRLAAPADRPDRSRGAVRDAVGVLDDVVAAQQHRAAGAEDDVGVLEASCDGLATPPPPASIRGRSGPPGRGR